MTGEEGGAGIAQPVEGPAAETPGAQRLVEHAGVGLDDPAPQVGADDGRNRPRQDREHTHPHRAAHFGVKDERRTEAERHAQRDRADDPDHRALEQRPRLGVLQDAGEIGEADEGRLERRQLHPTEAEMQRLHDRIDHHHRDHQHRGQHQDVGLPPVLHGDRSALVAPCRKSRRQPGIRDRHGSFSALRCAG